MHIGPLEASASASVAAATLIAVVYSRRISPARLARYRWTLVLAAYSLVAVISVYLMLVLVGAPHSLVSACAVFLIMGWMALARPIFALPRLMPGRVSEREARVYFASWSCVALFGRILRHTPLRYISPAVYLHGHSPDLPRLESCIVDAEIVHTWSGIVSLGLLVGLLFLHSSSVFLGALCAWILGDFFPIMHLRRCLYRLQRFLTRYGCFAKTA